jgi:parvulin-like peptidyl-prolyl isomerase
MLDRLDQVLWFLERHRVAVLGFVATAIAVSVVGLLLRDGGHNSTSPRAVPAGTVAVVGSQPITRATFDHWVAVYHRSGVGGASPSASATNTAVMQILVAGSWTRQEAARRNVAVTAAQLNQAIQTTYSQAKAQGVSRARVLQQVGGTEGDLRWETLVSLLGRALEVKAAQTAKPVTTAQIAAQYQAEPQRWAHPSRRTLQIILSGDQQTSAKALAALRAGTSWAAAAKKYATSSTAGTMLRNVKPATHDASFERVVFAAPIGRLEGPAQVGSGWIVFKVLSSTPLPATSLATATPRLRSEVTAQAQGRAVSAYLAGFRSSWKRQTRCLPTLRDATVCGT